uniref:CUB domain-containing protein n=1 Tax=Stegastes partitus TaxID=144197 RepID=A0A3B5ANF6_9TELE
RAECRLIIMIILSTTVTSAGQNRYYQPGKGNGGDGSAFFALRSCHQLLHGDSGEFFSPDYLCSNPSLWCNWTIQVDPGKRINLHLEDLTSDDACHLKKDQVHVDEPAGHLVGHKVLQKCWREAKYTSSSNTLHVVLLIGGWPSPPYRGFHGHYQAFGPPVVYNPQEGFTVRSRESESPPAQMDTSRFEMVMNPVFVCRLNAGLLYILWLQIGQEPGGLQVHRVIHSALQGLIAADVNECGTQLVLCDINADCVNRFGSYSCHCRPGFQDESRLGQLTSTCLPAGCSSGLSSEAKGVYVLFFLLSSLILMLLVAAGMLYRRHHRGTFLVRCHSSSSISPPDHNNNSNHHHHPDDSYSSPTDCDLPPPPPPVRGPREGWAQVKGHGPAVDLPLLRFSPLLPPDSYMDPQEGGKILHSERSRVSSPGRQPATF